MSVYGVNNTKYGIVQETAAGTAITTGDNLLLTTEREINIENGMTLNNTRKATGLSYQTAGDGNDFIMTNQLPTVTLPFHCNTDNMVLLLASLTQNPSESGSGPYVVQYDPYTTTAMGQIEIGDASDFYTFTLLKQNESGVTLSESLAGCVVRSMTITSGQGDPISISAEIVGMVYDSQVDLSGLASFTAFDTKVKLHSDLTTKFAGNSFDLLNWSMTITNNVIPVYGPNQTPQKWLFGPLDITLEATWPWTSTDYKAAIKADTDYLFEAYRGSQAGSSNGDISFLSNFVPDNIPTGNQDEMKIHTITGVGAYDGTNAALQIILGSTGDRLTAT